MPNFSLMIYDKPRKWITDSRAQGVGWEEIKYGRRRDYTQDHREPQLFHRHHSQLC